MTFETLSFEEFIERVKEVNSDFDCFKQLANDYYHKNEALLKVKQYREFTSAEKEKQLIALAKKCAEELPKYNGYDWKQIILDTCHSLLSNNKKIIVFGGTEEETDLYPSVKKFLKNKYSDYEVIDTTNKRTKFGRLADFTIVKKNIFGWRVLSFEVKAKPEAFDYFLNQADDIKKHSDKLYLFATPYFIIEAGYKKTKNVASAEKTVLNLLKKEGIGLYVIDNYLKFKRKEAVKLVIEAPDIETKKEIKNKILTELDVNDSD